MPKGTIMESRGCTMGILDKITEKTKEAVKKSSEMAGEIVEKGKDMVEKTKLESEIKKKKDEIGELVYKAYASGQTPDESAIRAMVNEIKKMEIQIHEMMQD